VTVSFKDGSGKAGEITADYCICTIPLSVLKQIDLDASAPFKAAMEGVAYAPVNKIGLQMKTRFWEENHHIYGGHIYNDIPASARSPCPPPAGRARRACCWATTRSAAKRPRSAPRAPADRAAFAVAAGQKIFPEYAESFENAFSFSWHLAEFNLGGWAEWGEDGRKDSYPVLCEPDGRLYLAGEHLSYLGGWQGGAIESAWQQIGKIHARVSTGLSPKGPNDFSFPFRPDLGPARDDRAARVRPGGHATGQFMDNCSACHQATGKGIKGAFPALAGSPFVQGDPRSSQPRS
jgi:monoamine oxidase